MKRYRNKTKGETVPSDSQGPNLNKAQCVAGAKARKAGKAQNENPFLEHTQSHRRWNRGWVNMTQILGAKTKPAKATKKVVAKKSKTSKAKEA